MIKIYLAGKMSGLSFNEMNDWRYDVYNKLSEKMKYCDETIRVINPVLYYNFQEKRHQTEIEVEEFDLTHVVTSDIIIVNLDGLKDSIGTIIELHDARYHNRIPVIAFGDRKLYDELHPWIKNDITRVENDIDEMLDYIQDFYLR